MVNNGVNAFKIPAIPLSILVSAMQNKYAGKKVPNQPEKNKSGRDFFGMVVRYFTQKGSIAKPALSMRKEAT